MVNERQLAKVAAQQHALITSAQLRDLGVSVDERVHRLAVGRLQPVHRGVYRVGGSVITFEQQLLAGCLAAGGLVGASHRSAAAQWDVDLPEAPPVELSLAYGRSARLPGVQVHRSTDLTGAHIVNRRGIPTTNPMRTLLDLGAVVPVGVVSDALDDLIGRRIVTIAGVRRTLEETAGRGRRGAGALREVLDLRTEDGQAGRSRLEARLSDLAKRAGLPCPRFQHPILLDGRRRRIDFAFPELMIAIEVDGYESHTRYDVFQDDRVRGNELQLAGWMVIHFSWHQVTRRPGYVVSVLHQALALAAAA